MPGPTETRLLATDQQRSVLSIMDASSRRFISYSPYGYRPLGNGLLSLLGFNGEQPDALTGHYHLGSGYRVFSPVLMRFNTPDSHRFSPFGKGGPNAYVYCAGDPVNHVDPTGHTWAFVKGVMRSRGLIKSNMQGADNAYLTIRPSQAVPSTQRVYRNTLAPQINPYPTSKTPAWTNQHLQDFAVTDARHPDTPGFGSSSHFGASSPNASPVMRRRSVETVSTPTAVQPASFTRVRRGGVSYDQDDPAINALRQRFGHSERQTQVSAVMDNAPAYDQFGPPSYESTTMSSESILETHHRIRQNP